MKLLSPQMLWEGFDPTAEPLDKETYKLTDVDGITTEELYFTGRTLPSGAKSRVYAVVCYKSTRSSKPALLVINEPSKPIDVAELQYWAKQGFITMAVDMRGQVDHGRFTVYPTELSYANSLDCKDDFTLRNTARETKWYEYGVNNMRAVTLLANHKYVKGISVLTLGRGARVGMMVLAKDTRVQNAAIVFGNLVDEYPFTHPQQFTDVELLAMENLSAVDKQLSKKEHEQIWEMGIGPQSYLPFIQVPMYVVCGGNSTNVQIGTLSKAFSRVNKQSKLLILPDAFDYLPNYMVNSIAKWFKGKTSNAEMKLEVVDNKDGQLTVQVTTNCQMSDIELWYCRDKNKKGKHWVVAPLVPTQTDNVYLATLDLYESSCQLYALAVANGEVPVSTPLMQINTDGQYALRHRKPLIYSGEEDFRFVPVNMVSDIWHGNEIELYKCKGYMGITGQKGSCFATFALSDSSNVSSGGVLAFDICCDVKQRLTIVAVVNLGEQNQSYVANVNLVGTGRWQRVILDSSDFLSPEKRTITIGNKVDMVIFNAKEKFIINNISLV